MNYKIVIDAGHGGEDGGATGNGIIEKDLTLLISNYMYNRLKELGIPVSITRTEDITLSPTERVDNILSKYGNNSNVIVVSNHINAGGGEGAEIIYALRNNSNLSNLISNNLENAGQNVRKVYQRRLPSDTSKDYYFIHRNTGYTQPIIVEYGFLDNINDANKLKNNWQNYTEAVVKGIAEYTNTPYDKGIDNYYIVKKGDTLYSIAKTYNTTVDNIKKLNNLTSNTLSIGQKIKLNDQIDNPKEDNTYIVKSGDTLYSIAKKFNIKVDNLKEANNLTSNMLSLNQQLIIPKISNKEDYLLYTVKKGDNLYNIANSYNTTVSDIMSLNNLSSNILSIGQTLKIPLKEVETSNFTEYTEYTIKKGDSLYSISKTYGVPIDEIMKYNGLTSNLLNVGKVIRIPLSNNTKTYIVKSGDTLYSIAKANNTTVDDIKSKNNLTSNILTIGKTLNI